MGTRVLAVGFTVHLIGAAILWLFVDRPGNRVWYTEDFGEWLWLAAPLVLVVAAMSGVAWRTRSAILMGGAGAAVALLMECALFVGWAVVHSA